MSKDLRLAVEVLDRLLGYNQSAREATRAEDIFEEMPVDLDTFVKDHKYLGLPPLSEKQRQFCIMGETIYRPETYQFLDWGYMKEPWWRVVTELVGQAGKGAGKDHVCLGADEEVITSSGVFRIDELRDHNVQVLTEQGWAPAQIKSFGIQQTKTISLSVATKRRHRWHDTYVRSACYHRDVVATAEHRWELVDGTVKTTEELRPGDLIKTCAAKVDDKSENFRKGAKHGFCFGDGVFLRENKDGSGYGHRVHFYGKKDERAKQFFEESEFYWEEDRAARVPTYRGSARYVADCNHKGVPIGEVSDDYVAGFIYGWFLADGRDHFDCRQILSCDHQALDWLEKNAPRGGWFPVGRSEFTADATSFGPLKARMQYVALKRSGVAWSVSGVEDYVGTEVFCAIVPGVERFTLAGGLYTSNCRIISSRICYLLLCLKNPQAYYGVPATDFIDILNVAYSAQQAESVFFAPFSKMLLGSPWFKDRTINEKVQEIVFLKGVRAFSGHSDKEGMEGYNLIVAILDEIAAFKTAIESAVSARKQIRVPRNSAEGIYSMAASSVQSRFPGLGKVILISYPRFAGDFIQRKYDEGLSSPTTFVSFGSTWEWNPLRKEEDFAVEFRKNPEDANAKYACKPPLAVDAFFKKSEKVRKAFNEDTYRMHEINQPVDDIGFFLPSFKFNHHLPCAAHVDLAAKHDRAGVAISHVAGWVIQKMSDGDETRLPVVVCDVVTSFGCQELGVEEIELSEVREFLMMAMRLGCNLRKVTYDQYQSLESLQAFRKLGIEAGLRSVDRDLTCYTTLKDLIYTDRYHCYWRTRTDYMGETWSLVEDEILRLTIVMGRKVDHQTGGSKDESDCLAGSAVGAIEVGEEWDVGTVEGGKINWTGEDDPDEFRPNAHWLNEPERSVSIFGS
jgi:hypothetical protein